MSIRAILATHLAAAREAAGLSQQALADIAGINRKTVNRIENQIHSPRLQVIDALAKALKMSIGDLLTGDMK